jgi:hypothetical protein
MDKGDGSIMCGIERAIYESDRRVWKAWIIATPSTVCTVEELMG